MSAEIVASEICGFFLQGERRVHYPERSVSTGVFDCVQIGQFCRIIKPAVHPPFETFCSGSISGSDQVLQIFLVCLFVPGGTTTTSSKSSVSSRKVTSANFFEFAFRIMV